MPRTNNSAEYHKQRRIEEPELYRQRGREYSAKYRARLKQRRLDEQKIEDQVMELSVEDLANLIIDNEDSDPDSTPAGVI